MDSKKPLGKARIDLTGAVRPPQPTAPPTEPAVPAPVSKGQTLVALFIIALFVYGLADACASAPPATPTELRMDAASRTAAMQGREVVKQHLRWSNTASFSAEKKLKAYEGGGYLMAGVVVTRDPNNQLLITKYVVLVDSTGGIDVTLSK